MTESIIKVFFALCTVVGFFIFSLYLVCTVLYILRLCNEALNKLDPDVSAKEDAEKETNLNIQIGDKDDPTITI